jgi:hypothetical protein
MVLAVIARSVSDAAIHAAERHGSPRCARDDEEERKMNGSFYAASTNGRKVLK